MGRVVKSNANPAMLKWCREASGLSLQALAALLGKDDAVIEGWESGKGTPTLGQLRKLAKRYRRPLMVFYLPDAKQQFTIQQVKDYRSLPTAKREFSERLRLAIRRCQERQAWAAGFLDEERAGRIDWIGSVALDDKPSRVAQDLRDRLGVTLAALSECKSMGSAYALWRHQVEALGVFVFQVSGVPLEEMRGCALPHPFAPSIIVNSADSVSARIFTAIHEVVHLLLGEAALSGAGSSPFDPDSKRDIERFCNSVAGETLVPTNQLREHLTGEEITDADLKRLATTFRVSAAVMAFRLEELAAVPPSFIRERWALLFGSRPSSGTDDRVKKIPPHKLVLGRAGAGFARLVVSAYEGGSIHGGELSSLLGMSMKHLGKLEGRLLQMT